MIFVALVVFLIFKTYLVFGLNFSSSVLSCVRQDIKCNASSPYRTNDGSCNNLNHPWLGMPHMPFSRILPSHYRDGVHLPPNELPSARKLRTLFMPDVYEEDKNLTQLWMQFGQLITHDMMITFENDLTLKCCDNTTLPNYDEICLPIPVPSDDEFYSQYGVKCLHAARHDNSYLTKCHTAFAEQFSEVTAYLDCSDVYGSTDAVAKELRKFVGGKLNTSLINNKEFLPFTEDKTICVTLDENDRCFQSGDVRVDQIPSLTTLATAYHLMHNKICDKLAKVNPFWDDEKIYQEARKIATAFKQLWTYKYWLPELIGWESMIKRDMIPKNEGFTTYNPEVDVRMINSFTTAAFRVPHSTIQGTMNLNNYEGVKQTIQAGDHFNLPQIIREGANYDEILLGMEVQPCRASQRYMTLEMNNKLLKTRDKPYGSDLSAIDLQRGRDHALGSYADALLEFFNHEVKSFEDFKPYINSSFLETLRQQYGSPENVDLFIGMVLEERLPKTRVGPVQLFLTEEQFYRTKAGDRFWFENNGEFTDEQLQEIRKITPARLICDGAHNLPKAYLNPFIIPSSSNPLMDCLEIPDIDYSKWAENCYDIPTTQSKP